MKKSRERSQIAPPRARKIDDRSRCEEQAEHRTNSVKGDLGLSILNGTPHEVAELHAHFFE